jgi:hypothetical protein
MQLFAILKANAILIKRLPSKITSGGLLFYFIYLLLLFFFLKKKSISQYYCTMGYTSYLALRVEETPFTLTSIIPTYMLCRSSSALQYRL